LPLVLGQVAEIRGIDRVGHGTVPEVELDPAVSLARDDPGLLPQDRRRDGVGRPHHVSDRRRRRLLRDPFDDLDERLLPLASRQRVEGVGGIVGRLDLLELGHLVVRGRDGDPDHRKPVPLAPPENDRELLLADEVRGEEVLGDQQHRGIGLG
jgi:hypothetical protein